MSIIYVDGLPAIDGTSSIPFAVTKGKDAYLKTRTFLTRMSLDTGRIIWHFPYSTKVLPESYWKLPRVLSIAPHCKQLWNNTDGTMLVDMEQHAKGGILLTARYTASGKTVWTKIIPMPAAAPWAEKKPAWTGAPTEEITCFFAANAASLVICLQRENRQSGLSSPGEGIYVMSMPELACQLDLICLDPASGNELWEKAIPEARVGILRQDQFEGHWSFGHKLGSIDWKTGRNTILLESPHELGEPVRVKSGVAVPWHDSMSAGITRVAHDGRVRESSMPFTKPNSTRLFGTALGLALQVNDQSLSWFGEGAKPRWTVRAKPYIYQVHAAKDCVLVATDGMGGKLFGFDESTGKERLQLKPALGGVGDLTEVPELPLLVSRYAISKSYSKSPQLLIVNSRTLKHHLKYDCQLLLTTWSRGVIGLTGKDYERVAIIDLMDEV